MVLLLVGLFYIANVGVNLPALLNYLLSATTAIGSFSIACYATAMLPFLTDQIKGATADELSTAVRWYYWADNFGYGLSNLFKSEHIQEHASSCGERIIIFTILPVVIVFTDWLCQQQLNSTPMKLVFQLLNYARKLCYFERHSTYIDEEQPADLSYDKDPKFCSRSQTTKDVKIVLCLVPLMMCINLFQASAKAVFNPRDASDSFWNLRMGTWPCALLLIPFCHLLFSRCASRGSLRVLQRFNLGMLSLILGFMLISVTGVYQLVISDDSVYKYLSCGVIITAIWPVKYAEWYWRLCPSFVWGIGKTIAYIILLEYVVAHSPEKRKGLVFVILLGCRGIISLIFLMITHLNFSLCFDLLFSLLIVALFVVFFVLSKSYALCERNREVNMLAITEEQSMVQTEEH